MTSPVAHLVAHRVKYMRTLTGRTPRRRPMPRALHPVAVVTGYTRILLDLVEAMRVVARRDLYPALERALAAARELHGRTDAPEDELGLVKANLTQGAFSKGRLRSLVQPVGRRTADWQKQQLQRQLRAAVGVEVPIQDPRLSERIEAFTEANVGLISSIPEQALGQVQGVVTAALQAGSRWEELAGDIEARFNVAESRAALIARDQVGKFYSSLNEARQKDLGIQGWTWRTANDERTCPVCGPLDGKSFTWKKPPKVGTPGQVHPQCRCSADPDVEGLLSALEGRPAKEEPQEAPAPPPQPRVDPRAAAEVGLQAQVVRAERLQEDKQGNNETFKVWTKDAAGTERLGYFKPEGQRPEFALAEVAAYRVGAALGIEVPPTVRRTAKVPGWGPNDAPRTEAGSIQLGVEGALPKSGLPKTLAGFDVDALHRMRAFDLITGNGDRHDGNVLWTKGPKGVRPNLIDNGWAFDSGNALQKRYLTFPDKVPLHGGVPVPPSAAVVKQVKAMDARAAVLAAKEAGLPRARAEELALRLRAVQAAPETVLALTHDVLPAGRFVLDATILPPAERAAVLKLVEEAYGH